MPDPGSHKYDITRTRRRSTYEDQGVPDQRADEAANADLQRESPPRRPAEDRASGPFGERPSGEPGAQGLGRDAEGGGIRLSSVTFTDHEVMPGHCSAEGENLAPWLDWDNVPAETVEVAVVCEDPDAPNGTFLHWMVSNIQPSVTSIGEEIPRGAVQSRNDFGNLRWDGPLPPVGDEAHRYFFRVYASGKPLNLDTESRPEDLRAAIEGSELGHGSLVGLYQR